MEIVYDSPPIAPALDVFEAFRAVKLSAAEKKSVATAREKLNSAATIASQYEDNHAASMSGREWVFQRRIWDASTAFLNDPTEANAERVGVVVAMSQCAKTITDELANVLRQLHRKLADELLPIALGVIDKAVAIIDPQVATARAALESAPGLGAEVKSFDQRVARLQQIIADERQIAERDALVWLSQNCEL